MDELRLSHRVATHPRYVVFWAMLWLLLAAAVVVAGCGGAANLRASIKTAITTAESYTVRTTRLLQADLITWQQAEDRLTIIKQAEAALGSATKAAATCDPATPATCDLARISYDSAQTALDGIELWLIEQEKRKRP